MYAVVAPGVKGIYLDYKEVEKVQALYPYAKFRKFRTEEECWRFIRLNENQHTVEQISNFGDTFNRHRVVMSYFIRSPNLYYNFKTKGVGTLHIEDGNAIIEHRSDLIKALIPNVIVDPEKISGHIIAIYNGIKLLGDYIDVEIIVPDHSIFYAIHSYSGNNWTINKLNKHIRSRIGNVSITLAGE